MNHLNYKPRIIDAKVEEYLSAFGAVCIEGPKWCGKTWTSAQHSKSEIYIGDPANNFQNRQLAELSPELVLTGEAPLLCSYQAGGKAAFLRSVTGVRLAPRNACRFD